MLAARAGSAEMVTLLFENRADPLIEDTTGLTALEYCGDDQVPNPNSPASAQSGCTASDTRVVAISTQH